MSSSPKNPTSSTTDDNLKKYERQVQSGSVSVHRCLNEE